MTLHEGGDMTLHEGSDLYYDPYDVAIDAEPYPVYRRLRDEAPLYYNERHDFFALSRYDDVAAGLADRVTYSSARGDILELVKSGNDIPPGIVLFEDPPIHTVHRGLLSRVFTPKKMQAIEGQVRQFCARSLDPLVGGGRFDFVADLGAEMPMRVIGMLLGMPEADQVAVRDRVDAALRIEPGQPMRYLSGGGGRNLTGRYTLAEYVDWRADHPSDDLVTELLNAEFTDETGTRRRLTRQEVRLYTGILAGAGNETTTRLIGWAGKVLADHPAQRRALVEDPSRIPAAIEELLRFEPPAPHLARYVTREVTCHGHVVPAGSAMMFLLGAANRDDRHFADGDRFDINRPAGSHLAFGYGIHFCLGAALARLEGRVALDEVLRRFPTWEIDTDHARLAVTSTVRGWESLPAFV